MKKEKIKIINVIKVFLIFVISIFIVYNVFGGDITDKTHSKLIFSGYCRGKFRITNEEELKASRDFLKRISKYNKKVKSNIFHSYKHLLSFIISICEKYAAWNGDIPLKDLILQTKENF